MSEYVKHAWNFTGMIVFLGSHMTVSRTSMWVTGSSPAPPHTVSVSAGWHVVVRRDLCGARTA